MNLMDFLKTIVYLLLFCAIVVTGTFVALNHFGVTSIQPVWMFSPAWIGGAMIVCILVFVGFVVMFRRR
ncbi:hypothetical protein LCGC14_1854380 [marine sediment metagenome]|uniref:Uncharacterized protein n=1 Tax=marine sediment metagenome TaxID=412755 RepID=A0A0F9GXP1_9ZZZZ